MNLDRKSSSYRSLPINSATKSINIQFQNTSDLHKPSTGQTKATSTNEEFAKLDALLADLLSEVEQPILLNPNGINQKYTELPIRNLIKDEFDSQRNKINFNDRIKYKTVLPATSTSYYRSHKNGSTGTDDIIFEEEDQQPAHVNNNNPSQQQHHAKTKFDYYQSNPGDTMSTETPRMHANSYSLNRNAANNRNAYLTVPGQYSYRSASVGVESAQPMRQLINSQTQTFHAPTHLVNNKPPLSPNARMLHSIQPTSQQSSFRTISMNTMKNIAETDDEIFNDPDFDRSSCKSGVSATSATQRSKYHTISNNFVEHTKPSALLSNRYSQSKRAVSAPPTDIGKILLQRIDLKSPLTTPNPMQADAQRLNEQYLNNRYNNRNVLRANTLQPQPNRGLYTRAASERPRMNNGYDTDTGLTTSYQQRLAGGTNGSLNHNGYQNHRQYDSDMDNVINKASSYRSIIGTPTSYQQQQQQRSTVSYGRANGEPNGYDTDTGLINARNNFYQRTLDFRNLLNKEKADKAEHSSTPTSNLTLNTDSNRFSTQRSVYNNDHINSYSQANLSNRSAFHSIKVQNQTSDSQATQISNDQKIVNGNGFNNGLNHDMSANIGRSSETTNMTSKTNGITNGLTNNSVSRPESVSTDMLDASSKATQKLIKTSQNFWYKPKISREDAINLLKSKSPGTFLIRDSNNFPGAYGLALKVDKLPPNVPIKPNADQSVELVRHFLIEPTGKGVRIKGCCNEPVFGSLASLVYQHSISAMALPCKLILPTTDLSDPLQNPKEIVANATQSKQHSSSQAATPMPDNPQNGRSLLEKGAACHVYYLNTVNVDNLNGAQAISKALSSSPGFEKKDASQLVLVQFKVNTQGIFITDLNRKKFTRNHYQTNSVLYCGIEESRIWPTKFEKIQYPRIFGVVCKPRITTGNHECHLFVELDPEQPAIAIVDFVLRYLIPSKTI